MPFGLTNAPATFQTYINTALTGLINSCCVVYLDDILIYSNNLEEHYQHVREVLARLREWKLYANPEKCDFHQQEVGYLGFRVSVAGLSMEQEKVEAIKEWPTPTTIQEIQTFLGFTGFYRRFIRGYARITKPLTDRLRKAGQKKFTPTIEEETATQQLKQQFLGAPVLRHFNPDLPIRIETDASKWAIGSIISQKEDGRWKPMAFRSRKLKGPELNYSTPDGELLGIVDAFQAWRHYLAYSKYKVEILTDHLNHRYLSTKSNLSNKQVSWLQQLEPFNYEIIYRPGKENPADGLSRRPDYEDPIGREEAKQTLIPGFEKKFRGGPREGCEGAAELLFEGTMNYSEVPTEQQLEDGRNNNGRADKSPLKQAYRPTYKSRRIQTVLKKTIHLESEGSDLKATLLQA